MQVGLHYSLSDNQVAAGAANSQRQVSISIGALAGENTKTAHLNLCLILDQSGSMGGRPLETVKQAAMRVVEKLTPGDRLSVVTFDHRARTLIANQVVENPASLRASIAQLEAAGGTAIDEGLRLGLEEFAKGKTEAISQAMLLTDGENEHGSNERCLKFAKLAAEYGLTVNTLGFGEHWNQDVLEQIADAGGGTLSYIERSEQAVAEFSRLFERMQSVGLTNARLIIELAPNVQLAATKPLAQVTPDVIELEPLVEGSRLEVRLGDLMVGLDRKILVNLYIQALPAGQHRLAQLQIRYDDPAQGAVGLLSEAIPLEITAIADHIPQPNPEVQDQVLTLAKYRQTQIAEAKLQQGDRTGAATMLQTAAKTALQLGDQKAATILQDNATRLQSGEDLSESDRKKTRIASKTVLGPSPASPPETPQS